MKTKPLTIDDLIRARQFDAAIERMQEVCRIADPDVPVDVEQVRREFEETRDRLKAVVPPPPFKIVVELVNA